MNLSAFDLEADMASPRSQSVALRDEEEAKELQTSLILANRKIVSAVPQ